MAEKRKTQSNIAQFFGNKTMQDIHAKQPRIENINVVSTLESNSEDENSTKPENSNEASTDRSENLVEDSKDVITDKEKTAADAVRAVPSTSTSSEQVIIPKGLTLETFKKWQVVRPWLTTNDTGLIICRYCCDVGNLGVNADKSSRIDNAFITGIEISSKETVPLAKRRKKLQDKIGMHGQRASHLRCEEINLARKKELIETGVKNTAKLWALQHKSKIDLTAKIFRTAYLCCKENLSFVTHTDLIELQELNGIDCGKMLYSNHAATNITSFLAAEMKKKLVEYMISSGTLFSVMLDESTSVSTKTCIIIYVRFLYAGEVNNFFLDLVELPSQTGEIIAETLLSVLTSAGLSKEIIKEHLIAICTDGASNLQGINNGALALLRQMIGSNIIGFHCLAHKLELAVNDVLKAVTAVSHFQMFCDSLFAHFSDLQRINDTFN